MEILKSKINQYPNYFLLNISRIKKSNNNLKEHIFNEIQINNKLKNKDNSNTISFHLSCKNAEIQTSIESNNNNSNEESNIIKPYIAFENKALRKYISSYCYKPQTKKLKSDKLFTSYFRKNLKFSYNKKLNIKKSNNNNISNNKSVKSIKKEYLKKNNFKINLNDKIVLNIKKQNKIKIKKDAKININSFYQNYYKNKKKYNEYKDYKDYKDYNNFEVKKYNNPILIKDLEISKLLKKYKDNKENINKKYLTPIKRERYLNHTQYKKIFITPDILNEKKTLKDLLFLKIMNTKIIINNKKYDRNNLTEHKKISGIKNKKYRI